MLEKKYLEFSTLLIAIVILTLLDAGIYSQTNHLDVITCIKDSYQYCSLGRSVSGIGDVNQDGYDDVIIGNDLKNNHIGEAWIVFGGDPMDSIPDIILHGENDHDRFGYEVSSIGDINGDECEDFAVNALGYGSPLEYSKGRFYLYLGGNLFDTIPDLILNGENKNDCFGRLIKRLCSGDVNNDGYDDILVSAPGYRNEINLIIGKVYLYYGGETIDTIPDWTLIGKRENYVFGGEISLCDVNGDDFDDILIRSCPISNTDTTVFSIFLGSDTTDTLVDYMIKYYRFGSGYYNKQISQYINNDNYGDFTLSCPNVTSIYFGSTYLDTTPDVQLKPWPLNVVYSLFNAGDVNRDGYKDIIAGAPHGAFQFGTAGIYLGGDPMNGEPDWTCGGSGGRLGVAVNGAGDINGDGCDDIIIGETLNWGLDRDWGKAWIFAGNPNIVDIGAAIDESDDRNIAANIKLYQNYPNPFNSFTTISYEVNTRSFIDIKIYDLSGKEVRIIVHRMQDKGKYEVKWDGKDNNGKEVASGIYLIKLKHMDFQRIIKTILIR